MLLDDFTNYLQNERKYSLHTVRAYVDDLIQFSDITCLDKKDISLISINDVRLWIIELKNNKISTKSINRKISALKTFFHFCNREKLIDSNPILKIKSLKEEKRLPVVIPEDSLLNLFDSDIFPDTFKGCRDRLILDLFYQTGIRLAELINIKMSHCDLLKKEIKILGKRNKERIIPLTDSIIVFFDKYFFYRSKILHSSSSSFLFVTENGKKAYSKMIYRLVNHYLSLVSSSKKTSPHVLRHAFATHLLNRGASLNTIKELLGHASLLSTQVYTHVSSEKIKKVYKNSHPRG